MRSLLWAVVAVFGLVLNPLAIADTPDPLGAPSERGYPIDEVNPAQPPQPAKPPVQPAQQPVQPAQQPAAQPAQQAAPVSALYATVEELPRIYTLMMQSRKFIDYSGHTLAAGELANCLPGVTAEQKVQALMSTLSALVRGNLFVVNMAFRNGIQDNPQMTTIAAVLVCKAAGRNPTEMATALETAYVELLNKYRLVNDLYQVEVAARMLK